MVFKNFPPKKFEFLNFTFEFVFGTAGLQQGKVADDVLERNPECVDVQHARLSHQLPDFHYAPSKRCSSSKCVRIDCDNGGLKNVKKCQKNVKCYVLICRWRRGWNCWTFARNCATFDCDWAMMIGYWPVPMWRPPSMNPKPPPLPTSNTKLQIHRLPLQRR